MNIYKTKSGIYINMDLVQTVRQPQDGLVIVSFSEKDEISLTRDDAVLFLEYLNRFAYCV
jgi:hypothetical protein